MKKKRAAIARKSFIIFMMFVYFFAVAVPPKKTDAILPLLIPVAKALVVDVALTQGIKYAQKTGFDKKVMNVAKNVIEKADLYDFSDKKITKTKGGKLDIPMSALDRAKVAWEVADEFSDVIDADQDRQAKTSKPRYDVDYANTDPFYKTSVSLDLLPRSVEIGADNKMLDYTKKYIDIKFTPIAFKQESNVEFIDSLTGMVYGSRVFLGGTYTNPASYVLYARSVSGSSSGFLYNSNTVFTVDITQPSWKLYQAYLDQLSYSSAVTYTASGVIVPETIKKVYKVPPETVDDSDLPNKAELSNKPISIDIGVTSDVDVELDWDNTEYLTQVEQHNETQIKKGDVTINNNYKYTIEVINNYYTDVNYGNNKTEIDIEIENNLPDPVDPVDPDPVDPTDPGTGGNGGNVIVTGHWLTDAIPIALLLSLLELLDSVVDYILRLVDFVVKIPLVPPKSFDNEAFDWFRSSKFLGIYVYNTVLGFATVGLSMSIYRIVRRFV